jgi:hypothetical protein
MDFPLMSALLLVFDAARIPFHWTIRWPMVVGAFTNSSLFLLQAIFPQLEAPALAEGLSLLLCRPHTLASIVITTYGFAGAAVTTLLATFRNAPDNAQSS